MSKILEVEPLVEKALTEHPETRDDNFLLYNKVLANYIDIDGHSIGYVFEHHKDLGIPSLETITRCRRKVQERDHRLAPKRRVRELREAEENEHREYALADQAWY